MSERAYLIAVHTCLFALQIIIAALVVTVNKELVALNPVVSLAQSYFPNPWSKTA